MLTGCIIFLGVVLLLGALTVVITGPFFWWQWISQVQAKNRADRILRAGRIDNPKQCDKTLSVLAGTKNDFKGAYLWTKLRELRDRQDAGTIVSPPAGVEQPAAGVQQPWTCPNCGSSVASGVKFCANCGQGLSWR